MAEIVYHCERNIHSLRGARSGLEKLLRGRQIASLLDVGSGRGTWLAAARELGIEDIAGIDGVAVDASELHIDPSVIRIFDLRKTVFLGRRFDLVLCLEVAEHLDSSSAEALIEFARQPRFLLGCGSRPARRTPRQLPLALILAGVVQRSRLRL